MTETSAPAYDLHFPQRQTDAVAQDDECVQVQLEGERREIRFHDYSEIYAEPGLYEQLFYDELECQSPEVVVGQLAQHVEDPRALRVLDVGAGNGMVGDRLRALGVEQLVGVDILEAAAEATERDRPGVYDDYLVTDLTALSAEDDTKLAAGGFNALLTVAALGFGDIPPAAFAAALGYLADGGLVGFTIKDEFLASDDDSGFAGFVKRLVSDGTLTVLSRHAYTHRLSVTGEELRYVAFVAKKDGEIAPPRD